MSQRRMRLKNRNRNFRTKWRSRRINSGPFASLTGKARRDKREKTTLKVPSDWRRSLRSINFLDVKRTFEEEE